MVTVAPPADSVAELALKTYTLYFLLAAIVLGALLFLAIKRTSKLCCWKVIYGVKKHYPSTADIVAPRTDVTNPEETAETDTQFRAPSVLASLQDRYDKKSLKSSIRSSVYGSTLAASEAGLSSSYRFSNSRQARDRERIRRYMEISIDDPVGEGTGNSVSDRKPVMSDLAEDDTLKGSSQVEGMKYEDSTVGSTIKGGGSLLTQSYEMNPLSSGDMDDIENYEDKEYETGSTVNLVSDDQPESYPEAAQGMESQSRKFRKHEPSGFSRSSLHKASRRKEAAAAFR